MKRRSNLCGKIRVSASGYGPRARDGKPLYYAAEAVRVDDDETIGHVRTENYESPPRVRKVLDARVLEQYRRCGIGTRMYTVLAKRLCRDGLVLRSDNVRSKSAEGFWAKQHAKGRATCQPATARQKAEWEWPCYTYTLKCPVGSLAGARGRRR